MSEPREPIRTEVHRVADPEATRVASYLAQPGEVGRVLLLYSGGLDTSVMLKWIQDEYEAEVVALTVNLGQPGEDYDVVKGKALNLGAIEAHVVDARDEFAAEYVLPAIRANANYGDGYPLFTALGRPLIAKLAVEYARRSGCDTIAHGCTGKGNDQVRIEGTVATLAPELKVIAPVRSWQMGRDEEIAYARKHGIPVKGKALNLGAIEAHVVDARDEFAAEYVLPAIRANANYGDGYPLFTALGRPLIAKLAVEYARRSGCDTIAHGCTGKGNDQVRIEGTVATLAPELKVIAPVRSWQMGRDEEIAYARKHGIPVKGGTEAAPYSIDDNLWGRSSEGKWIEDLSHAPDDDVFQLVTRPELAPDEPQVVEFEFERGVPVAIDGERLPLAELIDRAAELGCKHGVGIVDHIEDRIVGLKVRDIYEIPAAALLLPAHRELERLVGTIHQNQFKPRLDQQWAYLVYAGLWWEPLRTDIEAYIEHVNERVTGKIGLKLFKGVARVVTRESPNAVYDAQLATFAESGGLFSQQASPGFIEIWTLQSRMAQRVRDGDGG
jgi:argininosuccinate synthase